MELRWPARRSKKPVEMVIEGERVRARSLSEFVAAVQALGYRVKSVGRNRVAISRGPVLAVRLGGHEVTVTPPVGPEDPTKFLEKAFISAVLTAPMAAPRRRRPA